MMHTTTRLAVHAIDPERLAEIRVNGTDGLGNDFVAFPAEGDGGEPLRCCLRPARSGEQIALISFAPFLEPSVWREVGPVYVHAEDCGGYDAASGLPDELRTGPRVLRTYRADATMNYGHNTLVADGEDIVATVAHLLDEPDVSLVHVRTVLPQCFLYAVTG
jgi:hypothetical protein